MITHGLDVRIARTKYLNKRWVEDQKKWDIEKSVVRGGRTIPSLFILSTECSSTPKCGRGTIDRSEYELRMVSGLLLAISWVLRLK